MNNLETLYREDGAFRVDAIKRAADFIGTTSLEFAEEWLTNEPEPAEGVNGTADGARTAPDAKSDTSPVDSRTQLVADIQAWLEGNVGFSVWLTDVMEQVYGWLDRQAAITEHQTERKWCCYEDSVQAEIDRLQRRNDELRTSYDKLKSERDNLADDLLACNREREQLRKHLGIALDHAHDICSLVDIDGNVLDVGD